MTKVSDIRDYLFSIAPQSLKMDFDNVGLLVGSPDREVEKILVALDITGTVINEAMAKNAGLIVSHHPVIWDAMKSVTGDTVQGAKVMKLLENGISAVCMHTNLDIAPGGVNDVLMELLGAKATGILEPTSDSDGCGRVGKLPAEKPLKAFLADCKEALNANGLRYYDAGMPVKNLAVMGGSGGSCVELAKALGCDTYVTADVKHDQFITAAELGINLVDGGHFSTENPIVPVLARLLATKFPDISVEISALHRQTEQFFC